MRARCSTRALPSERRPSWSIRRPRSIRRPAPPGDPGGVDPDPPERGRPARPARRGTDPPPGRDAPRRRRRAARSSARRWRTWSDACASAAPARSCASGSSRASSPVRSARAAATRSISQRPRGALSRSRRCRWRRAAPRSCLPGATGVGKTTSLAKLSARLAHAGRRVAIATLDSGRVGALEQIRAFGDSIGVPAAALDDPGAFGRFSRSTGPPATTSSSWTDQAISPVTSPRSRSSGRTSTRCEPASRSSRSSLRGCSGGPRERHVRRRDPRAHRRDRHEDRRDRGAAPGHGARGRPRPRDRLPVQRARHRAPLPPRVRRALRGRRPDREDRLMSVEPERPSSSSRAAREAWARPPSPRTSASISPVRAGGSSCGPRPRPREPRPDARPPAGAQGGGGPRRGGAPRGLRGHRSGRCPPPAGRVRERGTLEPRPRAPIPTDRAAPGSRAPLRRGRGGQRRGRRGGRAGLRGARRSRRARHHPRPRCAHRCVRAHQGARPHGVRHGVDIPTPEVLVNHASGVEEGRAVARKLRSICERFLARSPRQAGCAPLPSVERSQSEGAPSSCAPQGLENVCMAQISGRLRGLAGVPGLPWLPEKLLRVISMAVDSAFGPSLLVHAMRASGRSTRWPVEPWSHCSPLQRHPRPDRVAARRVTWGSCSWWSRRGSGSPNARGPSRPRPGTGRGEEEGTAATAPEA